MDDETETTLVKLLLDADNGEGGFSMPYSYVAMDEVKGENYGESLSDGRGKILVAGDQDSKFLEKENELLQRKTELCEKFRRVLSERQEIRRKNGFLQKKMVEFFKRRKMDHVLKEDQTGLDVESKYLKRLYELEQYRLTIEKERKELEKKVDVMKTRTHMIHKDVKKFQEEFLNRQKKIASTLEIKKTGRKISTRAIENFIFVQATNAEEISKLRYWDIKQKRLLKERLDLARTLNNLGHGIRRADYEKLKFEYQQRCKLLEEKTEETEKLEGKVTREMGNVMRVQNRAKLVSECLHDCKQRCSEADSQVAEAQQRVVKLSRMCKFVREEHLKLQDKCGLLIRMPLVQAFEKSLAESSKVWKKLQQAEILYNTRMIHDRGGQTTTPVDFLRIRFDDPGDSPDQKYEE